MLIETQVSSHLTLDDRKGMLQFFYDVVEEEMKGPMLHPSSDLYFSHWTLVDHPLSINYS